MSTIATSDSSDPELHRRSNFDLVDYCSENVVRHSPSEGDAPGRDEESLQTFIGTFPDFDATATEGGTVAPYVGW